MPVVNNNVFVHYILLEQLWARKNTNRRWRLQFHIILLTYDDVKFLFVYSKFWALHPFISQVKFKIRKKNPTGILWWVLFNI
jgi:hypothetical protein